MTSRPDIVARVCDRIQFVTGRDPATLDLDKPLSEQGLDSYDMNDLEMALEDEFGIALIILLTNDSIYSIAMNMEQT